MDYQNTMLYENVVAGLNSATTPSAPSVPSKSPTAHRPAVLSLAIKERASLYAAYMPFIENGGLFVPTQKEYSMGDQVYVILQLLTNPKKFSISAKVVWISPAGLSQKLQGIGVQIPFDTAGNELRLFIEQSLGTALGSSRKTHTL
jgi:type IV pilus assembly protein PilZ